MTRPLLPVVRRLHLLCGLLMAAASSNLPGQPAPAAIAGFNSYARTVEARLGQQHRSQDHFLASSLAAAEMEQRLRHGELIVERLSPQTYAALPGALLHHWRAAAFVPGARAADLASLLRDFSAYPQVFSPQVVRAKVLVQQPDHLQASMRLRQKHVLTVVMDTTYDISFGELDPGHRYSVSHSTRISEIASPGTPQERVVAPEEEHGFLWKLNTYWSYEERDAGLYLQIETLSLSRSIPVGLGWALRPYVESVPRESLEFTLRSVCNALRR
jgi:hypothetical protein